tara:strand:- start:33655 stop:34818 length:1164 start_codon:yes stop_codon:yes gene_type:complete
MSSFHNPVTQLGTAYHRYGDKPFGIYQSDRQSHIYLIGQTGTGKSTLLGTMATQDAAQGQGFCLIDPHGDLALHLHNNITADHIYWNVSDPQSPFGYNPLTRVPAHLRPLVASGFIETLKKQWADSWGARMEHLLRYAVLALLEQPLADIRDISRLFLETEFRRNLVARISDPQVRTFWTVEFPKMKYLTAIDGVAPINNKLGAFLAHPLVRKAVCTPKEPLRFRQIMDDGKILIVNLAKGQIGNDNANVLGGLLVSNIMNAAFTRHDTPEAQRRPFFLYVDEFHNFTTTAFADMLSESRKYALGLCLSQQHSSQTEPPVFDAVMGNVGTMIALRVGAKDAPIMARQFGNIAAEHFVTLPNYHGFIQLFVQGRKMPAFSFQTRPPLP